MDPNMSISNNNQERNQRIDEIPKHYNTHYGYGTMTEENNQYIMQNIAQEQIPGNYIDAMDRQYLYNYPMYEGGIPLNTSIQPYRQSPYQMVNPYEQMRPGTRVVYNAIPDYIDQTKYQNGSSGTTKPSHRQKKNFLCC